jgi:hypothetical protein
MQEMTATAIVAAFRLGEITWADLFAELSTRAYTEPAYIAREKMMTMPERWLALEERDTHETGTWGEIQYLADVGQLTRDQYYQIADAIDARYGELDDIVDD